MTALPRRLSAPERRQQILDMAASLFVERGFESVTVADLAHELQTSRPTIYSYFPSTEAILDELLGQRLSALLSRLDPLLREELWEVFHTLVAEGATLIVSSHVMDEALRCDRLLLMRDGRLIADTTPARLLSETGAADPDRAFLTLIERKAG